MIGNIFGFTAAAVAAACVSACAQENIIASEDFEGTKTSLKLGLQSRITDVADEAIGGSRSLLCAASKDKPATAFEVSSDKFNVFEVSFNYKTIGGSRGAPEVGFIDQNGKLILSSRKSPHKHEQ